MHWIGQKLQTVSLKEIQHSNVHNNTHIHIYITIINFKTYSVKATKVKVTGPSDAGWTSDNTVSILGKFEVLILIRYMRCFTTEEKKGIYK